jgi:branched-chain amino acid transport system ATP-binding protein
MMLVVQDLHAFYGKSHVVQGVSLEVRPGQVVAMLGRNGVGKTTTLKAIMGLVRRSGTISVDGDDLSNAPPNVVSRRGIAYVPQGRDLFPELTVRENIEVGWHGKAFRQEDLEPVLEQFPALRPLVDRPAGNLSGGEQQMVALARALVNKPKVVLLDEPIEGLAPLYIRIVSGVIRTMRDRGMAVLLVEQNVHLALELCERVHFLQKGSIAHSCTPAEAGEEAVMRQYLGVGASHA